MKGRVADWFAHAQHAKVYQHQACQTFAAWYRWQVISDTHCSGGVSLFHSPITQLTYGGCESGKKGGKCWGRDMTATCGDLYHLRSNGESDRDEASLGREAGTCPQGGHRLQVLMGEGVVTNQGRRREGGQGGRRGMPQRRTQVACADVCVCVCVWVGGGGGVTSQSWKESNGNLS